MNALTGTGEIDDDEPTSEEELEKEREKEKVDEGGVAANYKPAHISEELAALGYYARSMKPRKGWLSERESHF
jgi:phosphatidylinositol phospholipase C delta